MFESYFKTALRHLRRQKGYAFINVIGLAVGLACSFFILLWITDELRYDRFHEDGDRLYRVMRTARFGDQLYTWAAIPKPLAAVLERDYPEITDAVLVTWENELLLTYGDQTFRESGRYADSAFFRIFSYPLLQGDPETALYDPNGIVLSQQAAEKLFGADGARDALGRTVRLGQDEDLTVTGVFEDVPEHSSYPFDFVLPFERFYRENPWLDHWGNNGMRLFVRLREGADPDAVNAKIAGVIEAHHDGAQSTPFLQPYEDIHLYSDFKDGRLVGGRIEYVRLFAGVAVFLLLIACINFMNLATARSARRAREIGIRKSVGASRGSMISQFLGESVLLAAGAFVVALLLVVALLPAFNDLTGKALTLGDFTILHVLGFAAIALATGLLAGSYPALYLSSFDPASVLRGAFHRGTRVASLRRGLVVFQFGLSILLIVGTLAVYKQLGYIQDRHLGLERENLLYFQMEGAVADQYEAFKQTLLQQPGIAAVTTSSQNPLSVGNSTSDPTWDGKDPDDNTLFHIINASYDFVETMGMELAAGRSFSRAFGSDSANYLINEETARVMGFDDPVGQRLSFWNREGEVIGVVKNFHFDSFYNPIEPLIIRLAPEQTQLLFARTRPGQLTEALAGLERVYKQFNPTYPLDYTFLDERFDQMYRSETMIGALALVFAGIAIFISCLGLFGLASFMAEQRLKEIGIRKVLGASVGNVVLLLSGDFTKLVLVAFVLAVPVAYFAASNWLDNFTYHTSLGVGLFLLAGGTALLIAWLTVSYQALKAAVANPVHALRAE